MAYTAERIRKALEKAMSEVQAYGDTGDAICKMPDTIIEFLTALIAAELADTTNPKGAHDENDKHASKP